MIETVAIPKFRRYENDPYGPPYFTVAHWLTSGPDVLSPSDPRAQLGWLDNYIDQVKGVLKMLEAWRMGIVIPEQPAINASFSVGTLGALGDLRACAACGAVMLGDYIEIHRHVCRV